MEQKENNELNANLHAEHRKEINEIRRDVENLLKSDLHLDHKMDMVIQAQKQMETGFGHARETGHKTWEAVQRLSGDIGNMVMSIKAHEDKLQYHGDAIKSSNSRWDRLMLGGIISLVLSLFGGLIFFLYRFNV